MLSNVKPGSFSHMTGLMFSLVSLPFPKRRPSVPTHLHLPEITPPFTHITASRTFSLRYRAVPKDALNRPNSLSLVLYPPPVLPLFLCEKTLLRGWRKAESSQGLSEYFIIQTMLESEANDHFSGADLSRWLDEGGRLHSTQVNSTTLSCSALSGNYQPKLY